MFPDYATSSFSVSFGGRSISQDIKKKQNLSFEKENKNCNNTFHFRYQNVNNPFEEGRYGTNKIIYLCIT